MSSSHRREARQTGMTKEVMQGIDEMREAKAGKSRLDQILEKKKKNNDNNEEGIENNEEADNDFVVDEEGKPVRYEDDEEEEDQNNPYKGPLTNFVKNMYISGNTKKPKNIGVDSKTVNKNKKTVQSLLNKLNDDDEDEENEDNDDNINNKNIFQTNSSNNNFTNNNINYYQMRNQNSNSKQSTISHNQNPNFSVKKQVIKPDEMEVDEPEDTNMNQNIKPGMSGSKNIKRKVKDVSVKKIAVTDIQPGANKRIIKDISPSKANANKTGSAFGRNIVSPSPTKNMNSFNSPFNNTNILNSEMSLRSNNFNNDKLPVENGFVYLYWIDAIEENIQSKPSVIFFGKIFDRQTNSFSSISLIFKNLQRKVYVMPKPEYDEPEKMNKVYEEFNKLRLAKFSHIKQFKMKVKEKNYCFELPIEQKTHSVLKVVYSAECGFIPDNIQGETFNYIFGKKASLLENIILSRKIKGPCWLKIKDFEYGTNFNNTWCKYEIVVKNHKNVEVVNEKRPIPPIKIMSISTQTIPNNNINELFSISCTMVDNYHIEDENGLNNIDNYSKTVFVRKIDSKLPIMDTRYDAPIKSVEYKDIKDIFGQGNLSFALNETALLSLFINKVYKYDPDFIVGHNIYGSHLEIITNRISKLKISNWSKLSKFKRDVLPRYLQSSSISNDYIRNCLAGRLLCDTFLSTREMLQRETNYDLRNICQKYLKVTIPESETGLIISTFKSIDEIKSLLQICLDEAYYSMKIMDKYLILPLTKQLTTIAGGLWIKSLQSSRANRCEMLLLHEFTEKNYIIPDKYHTSLADEEMLEDDDPDDNDEEEIGEVNKRAKKGRRKPQYAGGLVLEPITGLYDQIILLLDFNSLYPSIIQEYNICFTTVLRKPTQSFITAVNKEKKDLKTNKKKGGKKKKENDKGGDDQSVNQNNNENDKSDDDVSEIQEDNNDDLEHVDIKGKIKEIGGKGILPSILEYLVRGRREVKAMIKKESDPQKKFLLDIKQRALKITANSLYGYLGYKNSRFYAKEIAALITSTGRRILKNAASIVKIKHGLSVIYGDTDSVMINTMTQNVQEALDLGVKLKKSINEQYKLLEMDIDGLFKSLLLLRKKKYAAVKYIEPFTQDSATAIEMKGLDLVRRDWCPLAKMIGNQILDFILSGKPKDDIINDILNYMKDVGIAIDDDKFELKEFAITRQLAKNIDDYNQAKGLPHVNVAKRLKEKGDMSIKMMSYIPYIICLPLNGVSTKSIADRSYHPKEIEADKSLAIDKLWYKENQIIPIIRRLVIHIKELSLAALCESLGVENKHYYNMNNEDDVMDDFKVNNMNMGNMYCKNGIVVKCLKCETENIINSFIRKEDAIRKLLYCNKCSTIHNHGHVINSILHSIKKGIFLYYRRRRSCFKCKDSSSVLFIRNQCPDINCKGILNRDTTEFDTAQEIEFIKELLTPTGSKDSTIKEFEKSIRVITPFINNLHEKIKYNKIDLSDVMGFLKLSE